MKKIITSVILMITLSALGCTPYHAQGAGTGAAVGGVAGAVLDHRNPWRGGVIGALLGAVAGATIADISVRGSQEAYQSNRPVEYQTDSGRGVYRAEPDSDYYEGNGHTRCRKIREKVWEDGRLVKDHVKEVCKSESYERRY
jgi:hypothetical protein